MIWRIEICNKPHVFDAIGEGIKKDVEDLGIHSVESIHVIQVYLIDGKVDETCIRKIAQDLFCDKITQDYLIKKNSSPKQGPTTHSVEVMHNPGVMDPVEESALKGIRDLGIKGIKSVRQSTRFLIEGELSNTQIKTIAEKLLYNKVIQHVVTSQSKKPKTAKKDSSYKFKRAEIKVLGTSDKELVRISKDGQLFLNLEEMKTIKRYFTKIKRNPTDCELESIAQTWSEHCKHKTFRGIIDYKGKKIFNLLKSTVMKVTDDLDKKWCVSVFQDNSGVIRFDKDHDVCFKVETHNHPSALEPYGGAGTGIGGVIRDILGTGLCARPILNTDIFCFGLPDYPRNKLPKGVLHPKRVMKGVVSGVRDYGNRMGIPTSNGAVLFDERYLGNPLVYCGTVGIMPSGKSVKRYPNKGDFIVVCGGRTGRDGIHGATFSSGELTTESEDVSNTAVQIGNPITEKKMTDILVKARDANLFKAITDCGAGGLSSAVGEMGEKIGAEVYLERIPLKYDGLKYAEAWISEAQERMVLAVEPKKLKRLLKLFESEDVEATVIGKFRSDKKLFLTYNNEVVADLDMYFLHDGLPKLKRKAIWKDPGHKEPNLKKTKDLGGSLKKILSSWNVASKEWIIRQYDHEVQGSSVLKPLQGINNDGPGDACIIRPVLGSDKGLVVSNGINPRYGLIDPYHMAASAIDEALRQIICVGGNLDRVAILDNFCWGNTDKPDRLGGLVRASMACYDIAKSYGTPFISGKDSLNNEYATGKETIAIPPTLLISAMGVMKDVTKAITMDLKHKGGLIYVIGLTKDELGGSHYYHINGFTGKNVPRVDAKNGKKLMNRLSRATGNELVDSCHDCSEGGLGVTLAEMAFSGGLGVEARLKGVPASKDMKRDDKILFSESNTRFVVEVAEHNKEKFEKILKGMPFGLIGKVTKSKSLKILGLDGKTIVNERIEDLKAAWQAPFKDY